MVLEARVFDKEHVENEIEVTESTLNHAGHYLLHDAVRVISCLSDGVFITNSICIVFSGRILNRYADLERTHIGVAASQVVIDREVALNFLMPKKSIKRNSNCADIVAHLNVSQICVIVKQLNF